MAKHIYLSGRLGKGLFATVDDEDYERLMQYRWRNAHGYAVRSKRLEGTNKYRSWGMHNELLPPMIGFLPDHIDQNPLNNQKSNLRYATVGQNIRNSAVSGRNHSGFKGVSWLNRDKRWIAWIYLNGRNRYIGSFTSELEAAKAYNERARQECGEYAWLNPLPSLAAD